jgi:DNA repair protein RadC
MNAKPLTPTDLRSASRSDSLDLPAPARARRPDTTRRNEDACVQRALAILERRLSDGPLMTSPDLVRQYLRCKLERLEHEEFHVLFLDNQHRLIAQEAMFRGTIDGASVYPREVVKAALRHNAAAVVLAHNHPSGVAEPSTADKRITERLQQALDLVGLRVLDHLVVGAAESVSFAERGYL